MAGFGGHHLPVARRGAPPGASIGETRPPGYNSGAWRGHCSGGEQSSGRKLVMNGQAHVVSLPFMVLRSGQRVTHEMALAAQHTRSLPQRGHRETRSGIADG